MCLARGEQPIWYAARGRFALRVSVCGKDVPVVVYEVLRDIGVSPVACASDVGSGASHS